MEAFAIVLGSRNRKKVRELADLMGLDGIAWRSLDDFPGIPAVEESGATFAENARLKAQTYARAVGRWVLAEDSGLEVDALGGEPGVYSSRFAGEPADDARNNALLLERLRDVPDDERTARFVCHMVLSRPDGTVAAETFAVCRGTILRELRGTGGFGYDPLFEIREYHRTLAELGPAVKSCISHRARAARAMTPHLWKLAAGHPRAVTQDRV
ncbi:MAG: RdgB/HAM1 family non-canonical purine NTP pyrophosphatase [Thermogutta sp.]|nr:RdgB/HAM1 family non-canonical purine NTP pyrophosphatase [Thermogutta sp.]